MKPPLLLLLCLGTGVAGAQTLERFAPLVRANETYFAGPWSSSGQQPAASFVQTATEYDIKGVTNDRRGYVDVYAPSGGPLFNIGASAALAVTAKVLPGNSADVFRVFLIDRAGMSATATYRTADFSTLEFTTVSNALAIPAGFDSTAIERIRITGDAIDGTAAIAIACREIDAAAQAGGDGALVNFSLRGRSGSGANVLVAGFVVGGNATKQMLVRAVGPGLSQFGVGGVLADPELKLFRGNALIAANDNWSADAPTLAATTNAGAFSLTIGSRDAATLASIGPGLYTVQADGVGNTSGIALIELYDLDPAGAFPAQRFINVSARAPVGSGDAQLIAGFIVTGQASKRLLIRAAGPALGTVGMVAGFAADPQLTLARIGGGAPLVRTNDNWGDGNDPREIEKAASSVGAFPFASGSRDSAILVTVPPGAYDAVVSAGAGDAGIVLLEIYEVP